MSNCFMESEEIKRAVRVLRNIGGPDFYGLAINALEKQIPKKPIATSKGEEEYRGCPVCNKFVLGDYCQCCGQAIDWE